MSASHGAAVGEVQRDAGPEGRDAFQPKEREDGSVGDHDGYDT